MTIDEILPAGRLTYISQGVKWLLSEREALLQRDELDAEGEQRLKQVEKLLAEVKLRFEGLELLVGSHQARQLALAIEQ